MHSGLGPDARRVAVLAMTPVLLLGLLVILSSVGADAIGMTARVLLHPWRPIAKLAGFYIRLVGEPTVALVAVNRFFTRHLRR